MKNEIKPEISVVIINYKTELMTADLAHKLSLEPKIHVFVVDNSPTNELDIMLEDTVTYIHSKGNLGFAGGNNLGLKNVETEWVMFLNSDTLCMPEDVLRLKEITEKNNSNVSAPKIKGVDGAWQNNVGYFDGFFKNVRSFLVARPRYLEVSNINIPTITDFANGTAILIKREVIQKLGGWDEKTFFMYFEDIDLGYRLKMIKEKVLFVPEVIITHFGGKSSDQDLLQKNSNYQKSLRNYILKHRGLPGLLANNLFKVFQ